MQYVCMYICMYVYIYNMLTHVTYKSTWGSNHQKSPADGFSQRKSAPCLAGQKDWLRSLSILRTLVPGKLLLQHHQQVASSASRAKHFDKSTPWEPVKARADRCWWRSWISHDHRYSAGAVEKTHFWWTKQVDRWDSTWPHKHLNGFMVSTYGGGVRENVGDLAPTSSNFNMLKIIVSSIGMISGGFTFSVSWMFIPPKHSPAECGTGNQHLLEAVWKW